MKTNNTFNTKFNYTYKETGYNEQDFKKVYDAQTRSVDCVLKLPNENDKCVIEMIFETPDGKYNDFISSDLKDIVINGSDLLFIGIHFKSYNLLNDGLIINGDFILEIKDEMDGFHLFDFTIESKNLEIIDVIKEHKLITTINY
ncbi:hypothetical protein [Flavobacterium sp.]|jgi:hypothetical protein|uniref:hypothetical protein n=1 Tax=Flavobacterium sp. TaxID=239 RepID=UPI0037BFD11B